jgi:hypothetical protein
MSQLRIWIWHLLFGVPSAAFAHSVIQFASAPDTGLADLWLFAAHFLFGLLFGPVILLPAFSIQAGLFLGLRGVNAPAAVQVLAGGGIQAALVSLWAYIVGIEPSLPGRFSITAPMIAAGVLVGMGVAALVWRKDLQVEKP